MLTAIQNGMNDDSLAEILGRERVVGCVVELSAEIFTPGLVKRNTTHKTTWFALGELDGYYTPRVKELEAILAHVGRCDVTNNIYGAKWTKLIANTMTMGPFGLLGLGNTDASSLPGMFDISVESREANRSRSARRSGYRIEPIFGLRADEFAGTDEENLVTAHEEAARRTSPTAAPRRSTTTSRAARARWSASRASSARKGKELGIPTPFNDAVVEIDRADQPGRAHDGPVELRAAERESFALITYDTGFRRSPEWRFLVKRRNVDVQRSRHSGPVRSADTKSSVVGLDLTAAQALSARLTARA